MPVQGAHQRIAEAVLAWEGITQAPHRFGGVAFHVGRAEIGHMHGDGLVDIPFPTSVRDALVTGGEAEAHHVLPQSGWVSVFLRDDDDVDRAIGLLRKSYEAKYAKWAAR